MKNLRSHVLPCQDSLIHGNHSHNLLRGRMNLMHQKMNNLNIIIIIVIIIINIIIIIIIIIIIN